MPHHTSDPAYLQWRKALWSLRPFCISRSVSTAALHWRFQVGLNRKGIRVLEYAQYQCIRNVVDLYPSTSFRTNLSEVLLCQGRRLRSLWTASRRACRGSGVAARSVPAGRTGSTSKSDGFFVFVYQFTTSASVTHGILRYQVAHTAALFRRPSTRAAVRVTRRER